MGKNREAKRLCRARRWEETKREAREHKVLFSVYFILRFFVIAAMLLSFSRADYEGTFVCILVLVLFMIPSFIERKLRIDIPNVMEVIIIVFIFAAEILGELGNYYIRYAHWDTILHCTTGFLMAAVGYALVDILNENKKTTFQLSPLYLALAAFCFSMTVGVFWEFFEFAVDNLLQMDMQKDTVITAFSSVTLDPTRSNIPIRVEGIADVIVNGESLGLGGYLDIGLYDTMEDLFVNFVGAVVFSIIGFFYSKGRGKGRGKIAEQFIPRVMEEEEQKTRQPDSERTGE